MEEPIGGKGGVPDPVVRSETGACTGTSGSDVGQTIPNFVAGACAGGATCIFQKRSYTLQPNSDFYDVHSKNTTKN